MVTRHDKTYLLYCRVLLHAREFHIHMFDLPAHADSNSGKALRFELGSSSSDAEFNIRFKNYITGEVKVEDVR